MISDTSRIVDHQFHQQESSHSSSLAAYDTASNCSSGSARRNHLTYHHCHQQQPQLQSSSSYGCDSCDKTFTDPSNLQRHVRSAHALGGARAHSCPDCGKAFATSSGLKQHQHIHSSVKPFQCEVCLKAYTQFSNLCRHKRMHADCRQQIKCSDCGQAFSTTTSLSKHRRFCDGVLHRAGAYQHHHALSRTHLPVESRYGFQGSIHGSLQGPQTQAGGAKSLAALTAYLHGLYGAHRLPTGQPHPALFQFGSNPPPPPPPRQFPFFPPGHPLSMLPLMSSMMGTGAPNVGRQLRENVGVADTAAEQSEEEDSTSRHGSAEQYRPSSPSTEHEFDEIDDDEKDDHENDDNDRLNDDKMDEELDEVSVEASSVISRCSSISRASSCRHDLTDPVDIDEIPPIDCAAGEAKNQTLTDCTSAYAVETFPLPSSPKLLVSTAVSPPPEKAVDQIADRVDYANLGRSLEEDTSQQIQIESWKGEKSEKIATTDAAPTSSHAAESGTQKCNFKDVATLATGEATTQQPLDLTVRQSDLITATHKPDDNRTSPSEAPPPVDALSPLWDRLGGTPSHAAAAAAAMSNRLVIDQIYQHHHRLFQQEKAKLAAKMLHAGLSPPKFPPSSGGTAGFSMMEQLGSARGGFGSGTFRALTSPEHGNSRHHHHHHHHHTVKSQSALLGPAAAFGSSGKLKDRYSCRYCGKVFPRSANLTRHLRTHTGEQPYKCKYCERQFSISSNLQRHVRNIHNKEKPFRCPLCERCFGQQTNLDRHLKKHESDGPNVLDSPPPHDLDLDLNSDLTQSPAATAADTQRDAYFSEIRKFIGQACGSGSYGAPPALLSCGAPSRWFLQQTGRYGETTERRGPRSPCDLDEEDLDWEEGETTPRLNGLWPAHRGLITTLGGSPGSGSGAGGRTMLHNLLAMTTGDRSYPSTTVSPPVKSPTRPPAGPLAQASNVAPPCVF